MGHKGSETEYAAYRVDVSKFDQLWETCSGKHRNQEMHRLLAGIDSFGQLNLVQDDIANPSGRSTLLQ